MAWQGTAQHGTARHGKARRNTAQHGMYSTVAELSKLLSLPAAEPVLHQHTL